jgi:hypothetical protein
MPENDQAKWLCESPERFNTMRTWLRKDHPLWTLEQFVIETQSWKDASMPWVLRGICQLHHRGCLNVVKNVAVKNVASSFGCMVSFLETSSLPSEQKKEHMAYAIRLLKQLFWWKISAPPQGSVDDDSKDISLDADGFSEALRDALKPHIVRPSRQQKTPEFVTSLAARLWTAETMPKPRERKDGDDANTPRDEVKQSQVSDAGEDLFKEGDQVRCLPGKRKGAFDNLTAEVIKMCANKKVKIKLTDGLKDQIGKCRTVDAHQLLLIETPEEEKKRKAAGAAALFGETK